MGLFSKSHTSAQPGSVQITRRGFLDSFGAVHLMPRLDMHGCVRIDFNRLSERVSTRRCMTIRREVACTFAVESRPTMPGNRTDRF